MKQYYIYILILFSVLGHATTPYRTRILAPSIKTLQAGIENENNSLPIIELNDTRKIEIRFDEMSHETKN